MPARDEGGESFSRFPLLRRDILRAVLDHVDSTRRYSPVAPKPIEPSRDCFFVSFYTVLAPIVPHLLERPLS